MKSKASTPRVGVLVGGTWAVERVRVLDRFPTVGSPARILERQERPGGNALNVLSALGAMKCGFPRHGTGAVGRDEAGEGIRSFGGKAGIDLRLLVTVGSGPTAIIEWLMEKGGGNVARLVDPGVLTSWDGRGLDFGKIRARILHLADLTDLPALNAADRKMGTRAAALLTSAHEAGLKTCLSVSKADAQTLKELVRPVLKCVDYCLLADEEVTALTGFRIRQENGVLDTVALRHAAGAVLQMGIRELVMIRFSEGAFLRTRKGEDHWQMSLNIPAKAIRGTLGVADAFQAGALYGLHEALPLGECLQWAVLAANASILDATLVGGVLPPDGLLALKKKYRCRPPLEPED